MQNAMAFFMTLVEEEFYEVLRFLGALMHFVPWRTYITLRGEYAALVSWPAEAA